MPNYSFDPSDYGNSGGSRGGGGGGLIPLGTHLARVVDHELSETSGGLGQVIVTFADYEGRTRKAWLWDETILARSLIALQPKLAASADAQHKILGNLTMIPATERHRLG